MKKKIKNKVTLDTSAASLSFCFPYRSSWETGPARWPWPGWWGRCGVGTSHWRAWAESWCSWPGTPWSPGGGRQVKQVGRQEGQQEGAESQRRWALSDLGEDGHADVVVAGLVDESSQLVRRDGSRDGFLSGLGRETHRQVLLVSQQVRAGLQAASAPGAATAAVHN